MTTAGKPCAAEWCREPVFLERCAARLGEMMKDSKVSYKIVLARTRSPDVEAERVWGTFAALLCVTVENVPSQPRIMLESTKLADYCPGLVVLYHCLSRRMSLKNQGFFAAIWIAAPVSYFSPHEKIDMTTGLR